MKNVKNYRTLKQNEKAKILAAFQEGMSVSEITTTLEQDGMLKGYPNRDVRYDKVRTEVKRLKKTIGHQNHITSSEVKVAGDDVEVNVSRKDNESPCKWKEELVQRGLNPDDYTLEWMKVSNYEQCDANGEVHPMSSERYSLKKKPFASNSNDDEHMAFVEKYLARAKKQNDSRIDAGDYSLILPLADLHIGEEPAEEMVYSYTQTFVQYILPYMQEMYFENKGKVRSIDIVTLGDIVHMDTYNHTTTKGTYVGGKSSPDVSSKYAFRFLRWLIEECDRLFNIPVRLVYVRGNHDTVHGLSIIKQLFYYFVGSKNENISFSIDEDALYETHSANPQYMWVKYGNMGVTYCHGQFAKKNINNVPVIANRDARREVDFNLVIYGHLHHREESNSGADQHNYGLSTPNYAYDDYASGAGFLTDPEFYLFSVSHKTNRASYVPFPSVKWDMKHMK